MRWRGDAEGHRSMPLEGVGDGQAGLREGLEGVEQPRPEREPLGLGGEVDAGAGPRGGRRPGRRAPAGTRACHGGVAGQGTDPQGRHELVERVGDGRRAVAGIGSQRVGCRGGAGMASEGVARQAQLDGDRAHGTPGPEQLVDGTCRRQPADGAARSHRRLPTYPVRMVRSGAGTASAPIWLLRTRVDRVPPNHAGDPPPGGDRRFMWRLPHARLVSVGATCQDAGAASALRSSASWPTDTNVRPGLM